MFKAAVRDLGGVAQINQCLVFSIKDSADSQSFKENALRFLKNHFSVGAFIDSVDHGLSDLAGLNAGDRAIGRIAQLKGRIDVSHMAGDTRNLGSVKASSLMSLNVNTPKETLATSLSEQPARSRAEREAATIRSFFNLIPSVAVQLFQ